MKTRTRIVTAALATLGVAAITLTAAAQRNTRGTDPIAVMESGRCSLKMSVWDKDAHVIEIGESIEGTVNMKIDEFFGKHIVNACIALHNPTDEPIHCHYYIALYDRRGDMVGAAAQGTSSEGVLPGETVSLGSCLIPLPHDVAKKVYEFQATLYESTEEVGSK